MLSGPEGAVDNLHPAVTVMVRSVNQRYFRSMAPVSWGMCKVIVVAVKYLMT
jgi:hypothetical protein